MKFFFCFHNAYNYALAMLFFKNSFKTVRKLRNSDVFYKFFFCFHNAYGYALAMLFLMSTWQSVVLNMMRMHLYLLLRVSMVDIILILISMVDIILYVFFLQVGTEIY